jgi:hypothetical protein
LLQVLGEAPGLPSVFELAQAVATARRAIEVGCGSFVMILDGKNSEKQWKIWGTPMILHELQIHELVK